MGLINVVPALEKDIGAIVSLAEVCASQGSIEKQPYGYKGFIELIVRNRIDPTNPDRMAECFVKHTNKGRSIVGFSVLRENYSHALELWIVCVAADKQRKGYGEEFVSHAIDYACSETGSLYARCNPKTSQNMISLLEKFGFEECQPDGVLRTFEYPPVNRRG